MPFRVAYIVTHPIQYQAPLLRYLSRAGGIDLRVFFLSDFSLREHYEPAFKKTVKWDVSLSEGYAWEILPRLFRGVPTATRPWWPVAGLRDCLREGAFDAVWVHGWAHVGLCQFIQDAASLGLPVLLRGEFTLEGKPRSMLQRRVRDAFYLRWLFRRVAAFLCIGTRNREFYRQYQVPEDRLFSVPYAVDNAFFQARSAQAARQREILRRALGLQSGRPVILFAGKLIPAKAPDELLAAFSHVYRQSAGDAAPYLLYVGDGPLRETMAKKAKPFGDAVRFLGFCNQSQLPVLYDLCDVFVLPSRFEPWGLVVNEVMNAGRPIIVSDRVGAAADLLTNGDNGFVYPSGDTGTLAARLMQIFESPRLRIAMGEQSLKRINRWDFAADRRGLLQALVKVCQSRIPAVNKAAG
jgi:glycosyltransferase involved in cell wall biosynthesis